MGGNENPSSPNLMQMAQNGISFRSAFSQSNESSYSHAALFVSRMPNEIGRPEYLEFTVPPEELTLAEALSDIGYATGGFVAGGHIKKIFGFAQGFDTFEESSDFGSFFETVPTALRWLRKQEPGRPWFAFVHGYDCHRPYAHKGIFWHPFDSDYSGIVDTLVRSRNTTERIFAGVYYPDASLRRVWHSNGERMLDPGWYAALADGTAEGLGAGQSLTSRDLKHLKAHYDSGVLAADTYVGLLAEQLKRANLWENTLVILVSDHGEDLQDHGFTNHRAVLFDSTTHVPMIWTGGVIPESLRGLRVDSLVDALDLVPTVMAAVGTVAPAKSRGRDLWTPVMAGQSLKEHAVLQQGVLGQTSLRTATHRLTFSGLALTDPDYLNTLRSAPMTGKHFGLYAAGVDPMEKRNIVARSPELARRLRSLMVDHVADLTPSKSDQQISPQALQELQSHGYW